METAVGMVAGGGPERAQTDPPPDASRNRWLSFGCNRSATSNRTAVMVLAWLYGALGRSTRRTQEEKSMPDNTRVYWLQALTPLHVGAGRGVGYIDLPIMREKVTQWPL